MKKRSLKITLSGSKGSGKTFVSEKILEMLEDLGMDVVLVDKDSKRILAQHDIMILDQEVTK